ncbi:hypothetical protein BKA93DRAFT_798390 [Sparassis latifolia]
MQTCRACSSNHRTYSPILLHNVCSPGLRAYVWQGDLIRLIQSRLEHSSGLLMPPGEHWMSHDDGSPFRTAHTTFSSRGARSLPYFLVGFANTIRLAVLENSLHRKVSPLWDVMKVFAQPIYMCTAMSLQLGCRRAIFTALGGHTSHPGKLWQTLSHVHSSRQILERGQNHLGRKENRVSRFLQVGSQGSQGPKSQRPDIASRFAQICYSCHCRGNHCAVCE